MNKSAILRSMVALSNSIAAARTLHEIREDLYAAACLPDTPMRQTVLNNLRQSAVADITEIERIMRIAGPVEMV